MSDLPPCPSCGSAEKLRLIRHYAAWPPGVICKCGMSATSVERWNARALPVVQPDREYVAFSMWKAEADRAAPNVGKNRTPEGFAEAAEQERTKWLMLADAAIFALKGETT